jgi:hypothetical protein
MGTSSPAYRPTNPGRSGWQYRNRRAIRQWGVGLLNSSLGRSTQITNSAASQARRVSRDLAPNNSPSLQPAEARTGINVFAFPVIDLRFIAISPPNVVCHCGSKNCHERSRSAVPVSLLFSGQLQRIEGYERLWSAGGSGFCIGRAIVASARIASRDRLFAKKPHGPPPHHRQRPGDAEEDDHELPIQSGHEPSRRCACCGNENAAQGPRRNINQRLRP